MDLKLPALLGCIHALRTNYEILDRDPSHGYSAARDYP